MLDGSPEDPQATHPLEVWTGINFGIGGLFNPYGIEDGGADDDGGGGATNL